MSNQKLNLMQSSDKKRIVLFSRINSNFLEVRFSKLEAFHTDLLIYDYVDVFSIGIQNEKESELVEVAKVFLERGLINLPNLTVFSGL